jgi:DME family drug/metabolite transporter
MNYFLGVIYALIASTLWSLSPGLISRFGRNIGSATLNMLRAFYGVVILLIIEALLVNDRWFYPSILGIGIIYVSAFFGPLLGDTLYIHSIKYIGGGNAVTISYLYIFFAQLYSYLLYRENIRLSIIIGSLIAITGVYIVYRGSGGDHLSIKGLILAVSAALSWGMGVTLSKLALLFGDPATIALLRNTSTMITLLPITFNEARTVFRDKYITLTALVTGGIGFGIGMTLFLSAINNIGVSATVLATSLTPVLGRLFARIIASEKPSMKTYVGTIITSIGIFIGVYFQF